MSENARTELLRDKHRRILREIGELQAIETALFQHLQDESSDEDKTKKIEEYVNNLVNIRARMQSELSNIFSRSKDDLAYNTGHLENQNSMSSQLQEELRKARDILKSLKAEKNNKTRLAQIEYNLKK